VRSVPDVRVRRVGFRSGTDADLTALHAIEAPVSAETGSRRMPRALGSYIAFARNLPSQFHDHAWLAEAAGGEPVAAAFCWSNAAGGPSVMECDVLVRRDRRRSGVGSSLFAEICDQTAREGRSVLTWSTFDAVRAGDAFSRRVGGRVARVNRTSELRVAGVDWQMIERWALAGRARARGYALEMVDGPFPEHLRADGATFHHIMQTAPRDELEIGDVLLGADDIAELDDALRAAGRTRWTVLVRGPTGACVGGTEMIFEAREPTVALQQNTGIDPAHRGLGLAKWAKAVMLDRLWKERPGIERVRTDNAFSNAPMLGINDALGFEVVATRTEWQAEIAVGRVGLIPG
jgi:GNAT superfamily N-acetyltransferase